VQEFVHGTRTARSNHSAVWFNNCVNNDGWMMMPVTLLYLNMTKYNSTTVFLVIVINIIWRNQLDYAGTGSSAAGHGLGCCVK
jgi:hypothetical protein